jgi:two-component sensor histidine kinase
MTMALLVHELATNAAKYGALSVATGRVAIRWSLCDTRLDLEWRESDGPIITAPTGRGFGMRLLSRALDQFGGTVETTFEPTGLICNSLEELHSVCNTANVESDVTFYKRAS